MFMICLLTKFGVFSSNGSLIILITSKSKGEFRMADVLVLLILGNRIKHDVTLTSSDVPFVPCFMKVSLLFQRLNWGKHRNGDVEFTSFPSLRQKSSVVK
jgi:hypothetical protein